MRPTHLNALRAPICACALIAGLSAPSSDARFLSQTRLQTGTQSGGTVDAARRDETIRLPGTPAGKTLGEFIRAFNTGDLGTLRRFHKDRGGDEENARQDIEFYQQTGGLKLHSVTRSDQFEIEILVQTKKEERWMSLAIGVEPATPHGIADIRVRP